MSTRTKLDPMVRVRRRKRAALLREPLRFRKDLHLARAILAELNLIRKSSRLHGDTKHTLFVRGAKQLAGLQ
jgi:hypothetical protein